MAKSAEPVVLELAMLPREQAGPFLLLGLPKDADKKQIELHWAERVKWARKNVIKVPLEDVNWAREMLSDIDKRLRADAGSFNADTVEGLLTQLGKRYGGGGPRPGRAWQPLDREKPLADYVPPAEVPDHVALRQALAVPDVPEELPFAPLLLERLAREPLDPWALDLPRAAVAPGP